jgi:hypothetical protein
MHKQKKSKPQLKFLLFFYLKTVGEAPTVNFIKIEQYA